MRALLFLATLPALLLVADAQATSRGRASSPAGVRATVLSGASAATPTTTAGAGTAGNVVPAPTPVVDFVQEGITAAPMFEVDLPVTRDGVPEVLVPSVVTPVPEPDTVVPSVVTLVPEPDTVVPSVVTPALEPIFDAIPDVPPTPESIVFSTDPNAPFPPDVFFGEPIREVPDLPVALSPPRQVRPTRRELREPSSPAQPAPQVAAPQIVVPTFQLIIPFDDRLGQGTAPGAVTQTSSFPFNDVFSTNAAPAQGNGGNSNAAQNDGGQNGDNANQSALIKPYVVQLRRRSDFGYFCAGALIGRRTVLTAAHCVDSSLPGGDTMPEIVVGSARLSQTSGPGIQVISTERVTINPGTSEGQPNLAVIRLGRRANQGPVGLPNSANFSPNDGETLTGIGWGRTSTQSAFSDLVQFFQTSFVQRNVCSESLNREIAGFNLCVGGEGGSSCSGDDGGPIIAERNPDLLVGVIGSQHACGEPRIDVHNSIASQIDWIRETRRNS